MKKIYFFTSILLIMLFQAKAQMGINKDGLVPHPSAMLDIKASSSTNAKGLLMPRVADHTVITSPATGLMVFNTTTNTFWYFNGLAWANMGNGGSSGAWLLNGNNVYTNNNNVGINTATSQTTLDVKGDGFLVSQKTILTTEDPNNHPYNMPLNNVTYTDAAGILYDPSGPSANYPSGSINTITTINTSASNVLGIKLTFEVFDTEVNGDSIIIMNGLGATIVKYSGNTLPPDFYYNGSSMQIKFKTNGNSIVGQGFKIKWQRVDKDGISTSISGIIGNNAYFDTSKGAFRSGNLGQYSTEPIGNNSVAMGFANRASGNNAIAMGNVNNASGSSSIAMGVLSNASTTASFASGLATISGGYASTAMGNNTNASGFASTALGSYSAASGDYSTAMGNNVNASYEGSFVIGDSPNSSTTVNSSTSNTFSARFRSGYNLYTSATLGTGVVLSGGGNSWSTVSDSTKKENFLLIDGENVLKKIANMRTVTWNYKGQDPKLFRHYGPMAQEFFSAFGRDKLGVAGNDTTIASADFDGVNFTAIKALEKRTSALQTENELLKKRLAILEKSSSEILGLKAEMEQLKAFLIPENEKMTLKTLSEK